jgi:TonB-linked SusC/RagA family outer membrane protein
MKRKPLLFKLLCAVACLFIFIQAYPQVNINGSIRDENNMPLPGVTILEKGTNNGCVTDIDGNFTLSVKEKAVLVISYVGYLSKEISVKDQTDFNINLEPDIISLDDVVVVGYGVQKKSDLTGAVTSISSEDIQKIPIPSIDHALQGQAAGVNIIAKSGRPGESADIQIRGISSINGTQPLIIIDGVPGGDLNTINPSDIASIEVLKDASTAAIYGSTGGNGVILITTKSGTQGKLIANLNVYRGWEYAINKIELMNSQEYMAVLEESSKSATALNDRPDTLKTYNWQDIVFEPSSVQNYDLSLSGGTEVSSFFVSAGYNKQEGIIRNSDYERFNFRVNAEQKLVKRIKFEEKISYVNTVGKGFEEWQWHNYYANPIYSTLIMDPTIPAYYTDSLPGFDPTLIPGYVPKYKWTRSNYGTVNPLVNLDMKNRTEKRYYLIGNIGITINIFKGLDIINRLGGELYFGEVKEYEGKYWASETNNRKDDRLIMSMNKAITFNLQNIIQYNQSLGNHNVLIMAGHEATDWTIYDINGYRLGMTSDDPWMLYPKMSTNDSSTAQLINGSADIRRKESFFGRFNYDFKGKYLLSINIRRDGASNFGPNNRWGIFPSFSLGWKFSEESFIKNIEYISFGKIRGGYGKTGANARSGFPFLPKIEPIPQFRYSFDNEKSYTGMGPTQIANPDIGWETVNMTNIGIDLGFFSNRLFLSADYFSKVSIDMLMSMEVSRIAGTYVGSNMASTYPEVNFGKISNKGFEFTLSAKKKEGQLKGSIDLNITTVKNKVLKLTTDSMLRGRVHTLQPTNITYEGAPVAQFYGWKTNGLFRETDPTRIIGGKTVIINQPYYIKTNGDTAYAQQLAKPGDLRYVDLDGDGQITNKDRTILGSPLPKLIYGFTINLEYKIFDLSAFFNGTLGNKILNGTKQYLYYLQGSGNHAKDFTNRYVEADIVKQTSTGGEIVVLRKNVNTDLPRNDPANYNKLNPFFIEDGSYLRLRNLVLGVNIPQKITSKVSIQRCRLYFGAKNLFTITKYTGFSPDVAGKTPENPDEGILELGVDLGIYPVTRMYYFGANITF